MPNLDPVLLLFLSLRRGFVSSLSVGSLPSFFAGVVLGFLAAIFHLLGLTWVHGPDCRSLWNPHEGSSPFPILYGLSSPCLFASGRFGQADFVSLTRYGITFLRFSGLILPFALFGPGPCPLISTLLLLGLTWALRPDPGSETEPCGLSFPCGLFLL